ncbi:MAG: flagellar filament capping protein FliD [Planctomyces sp.]|nr:flagellar filament capping protein FliD [Planctomyces sp.]
MAVTIDGLVSGIDTENIINGLLEIQQAQVDRFTLRKTEIQQKQTAFRGVEARLLTFRSDASKLSRSVNNPFTRQTVSVSDESAISATADTNAAAGEYRITVNSTARAHQIAAQGYVDGDAEITQGTVQLRVGSGEVKTVTIDPNNNTLNGLANAINAAGAGVSASIVKDSAGGATPWRLVLTATKTGTENTISVTNNLAASSGNATRVEFNTASPVQAAADAQIQIGSGLGAISVSSSSNRFEDVIAGVDFDLLQADSGDELRLTVRRDTESATADVEAFVKSFNDLMQYIDDQSKYNPETEQAGLLLGNRSVTSIQQKLRSAVLDVVPGINPAANRLSAIGITVTDKGRLQLNNTRLQDVLNGRVEGVSSTDVKRLFALDGVSTNPAVSFVLGSSRSKASETPYQLDITQAAEQANLTATSSLAASTVISSANRELELTIDGATTTLTLADGTYTRQELADHLESLLSSSTDLAGRSVTVGLAGDALKFTTASYGSSSEVRILSGNAINSLGLIVGLSDTGRDVAGSFIVNGQTEAATGRGRLLTGESDNEYTADLQLRVSIQPANVISGSEGQITVTRGLGASLDKLIGELINPENGAISAADDGFDGQIESIQKALDRQKGIFDRQQASLLKQFSALEAALGQLQSTSSFLTSQLAAR